MNRYFMRTLLNLEKTIQSYKDESVALSTKRKIVISIPEPIPNQTDWGEVDDKRLDFSVKDDRIKTCN